MITRRDWLKRVGLGAGAALLGPFLHGVARAQAGATRRFLFVVEGNCVEPITLLGDAARATIEPTLSQPIETDRWWYRRYTHSALIEAEGGLATATALADLGPVEEHASALFGLSSKICGGGHSALHGALSSTRSVGGAPGGPTIDAWLAARPEVRGGAPFDAVRLGVTNDAGRPLDFGTCAYDRGQAAPLLLQPDRAFQALFGSVAGDGTFGRRGAQLDFAARDVRAALQAFSGNSAERAKLEAYLASIEVVQARRARLIDLAPQIVAARPEAPEAGGTALERLAAQFELATAAFLGGLTHVCVVGIGTGGHFTLDYPEVIQGVGRHDLHHGSAGTPAYRDAIHEVSRRQIGMVLELANRLAAVPEAGGSVLDHTVIVYLGDNGEQHHSTASEFPVLLMGGAALGLRTGGRSRFYPGLDEPGHRQLSNLWNSLGHLAGAPLNDFGAEGPSRIATGPLDALIS